MGQYELTADATVPTGTNLTATLYEDVGGDGTADNQSQKTLGDGTVTYTFTGFDAGSGNSTWIELSLSTNNQSVAPSVNSLDLVAKPDAGDGDDGGDDETTQVTSRNVMVGLELGNPKITM